MGAGGGPSAKFLPPGRLSMPPRSTVVVPSLEEASAENGMEPRPTCLAGVEDGLVRTAWGRAAAAAAMRCPDRPRTVRPRRRETTIAFSCVARPSDGGAATRLPLSLSLSRSLSLSCGASAELILFSASRRRRARIPFFSSPPPSFPSLLPSSICERGRARRAALRTCVRLREGEREGACEG